MLEQFSRGHDEASQGRGRRNALASKRKVKEEREKQRDRLHACSQQLDLDKLPLNFRLNHICSEASAKCKSWQKVRGDKQAA